MSRYNFEISIASIAANLPPSSATNRLQPLSTSRYTRSRSFVSNASLAVLSPVETQLSIQTRATSSYSSRCAGRTKGHDVVIDLMLRILCFDAAQRRLGNRPLACLARRQAHGFRDLMKLPRQRAAL